MVNRIRTVFTGVAGTPWYSNIYFAAGAEIQASVDRVGAFWEAVSLNMTNLVSYRVQDDVTQIDLATGQPVSVSNADGIDGAGQSTGDPLPYATQCLGNLLTGTYVNGRQVRGKIYVPGWTEPSTTGGQFNTNDAALVANAIDAMHDIGGLPDTQLVVYSPKNHAAYPVTGWTVPRKPAVLRSRRD